MAATTAMLVATVSVPAATRMAALVLARMKLTVVVVVVGVVLRLLPTVLGSQRPQPR
jgi:hypothetical protein